MKSYPLFTLIMMFGVLILNAQTTILDFETPATTATFEYFGDGSSPGGVNAITNPAPGGINTSATVGEFIKPAGSQTWAGAFADPPTAIDFTSDNAICLKVWLNEPTNLLLKAEEGLNNAPDWELAKQIDDTQTWVEVCYNVTGQTAENQVYNRLVLFFDFGTSLPAPQTYYFDDVVTKNTAVELHDVTFSVNMNTYPLPFDTVYVSGTFNGFDEDSNPMTDSDGDGIWTHTIVDMLPGDYEYLFQLDEFVVLEDFSDKYYDCTKTTFDPPNVYINRTLTVNADAILPTVCFNSCYDCGDAVTLVMHLGEGSATPSPEGFYVAGGGNFDVPGVYAMTDSGNGIHTAIFEKPVGFASHYAYANGACSDFSCKEVLTGQSCADPSNFDDRFMGPLNQNTIITDCFELCNTAGTTCLAGLCPPNYAGVNTLTGTIRNYTIYNTNGNIESTQMIQWSGDVEYSGGTEIMLDNGFEAGPGVEFKAVLDGCN